MYRVLVAGLFHESHSFTDDVTRLPDFRIFRGEEVLARVGDGSQIDGFLQVAARRHWRVVPAVCYEAMPSGVVNHNVFEWFWSELEKTLRGAIHAGLDGIYLSLHGATVTTEVEDAEGELLRRIRAVPCAEALPLFGVFDLHANVTEAMCKYADGLICYRENPHTDAAERGMHAAELLHRCLTHGRRPRMFLKSVPILWPPTGTATAEPPMSLLEDRARSVETQIRGILAVNVTSGFSFSDVREAGVTFSVVAEDNHGEVEEVLNELAHLAWRHRESGLPDEKDIDQVLSGPFQAAQGPVLLVEPADNIGGGGPGDCTDVLRALIRHDVSRAGVIMADAAAVRSLRGLVPGDRKTISIGGRGSRFDLGPVNLDVEFVSRSDGRFVLEDRQSHFAAAFGREIEMGDSAVVRHRGITILINSRKTPPWDLGQWRSQGIEPGQMQVIGIKAAVAHRRAYCPIAATSHTVRTRGPCSSNPSDLPYCRVRRPVFPLDALETWI